jgi:hypothetical protein
MTRMYNQRGESKEGPLPEPITKEVTKKAGGKLYRNPIDCLIQTVRTEGPLAVYKVLMACPIETNLRDFLHICCGLHLILFCIPHFNRVTNNRTLTFMEQVVSLTEHSTNRRLTNYS